MGTYEDIKQHHKKRKQEIEMQKLKAVVAKADQLPDGPKTDGEINRHQHREQHASWKIICSCGTVKYYDNMDIGQLNNEIQHNFHPTHLKAVFFREGARNQFRGSIPAMVKEE